MLDTTQHANLVQIILIVVLGVCMCAFLSIWTWLNLQDVAKLRLTIYRIFLVSCVWFGYGATFGCLARVGVWPCRKQ